MFTVQNALEQLESWLYYTVLDALNQFNKYLGNMGADLFNNDIIQGVIYFFQLLGEALFVVGFILALLEYAIEAQDGKGSMKDTALNIGKGMMACALFTTVPIKLYQLSVDVQASISSVIRTASIVNDPVLSQPTNTGSLVSNVISFMSGLVASNPILNIAGAVGSF